MPILEYGLCTPEIATTDQEPILRRLLDALIPEVDPSYDPGSLSAEDISKFLRAATFATAWLNNDPEAIQAEENAFFRDHPRGNFAPQKMLHPAFQPIGLGILTVDRRPWKKRSGKITDLVVLPGYDEQEVESKLLDSLIQEARRLGLTKYQPAFLPGATTLHDIAGA